MNATSTPAGSTVRTTLDRVTAAGFRTTRRGRLVSIASAVYVASWATGLISGPSAPAATASAEQIHTYYATEGTNILVQSSLIHGIAGITIAVLALAIPAATSASTALGRLITSAGITAALVSLLQVAFAAVAVATSSSATASASKRLFDDLNVADTVKLTLLAVFVAAVTLAAARARMIGRRTGVLTAALVVSLPVGGAAFLIDNPLLIAVLYASLPLLLTWVAALGWQVGRRAH